MNQLGFLLLVGDLFHDCQCRAACPDEVISCDKSSGEDNPVAAGLNRSTESSISGIDNIEGHGGDSKATIHRPVGNRNDASPVNAVKSFVIYQFLFKLKEHKSQSGEYFVEQHRHCLHFKLLHISQFMTKIQLMIHIQIVYDSRQRRIFEDRKRRNLVKQ